MALISQTKPHPELLEAPEIFSNKPSVSCLDLD